MVVIFFFPSGNRHVHSGTVVCPSSPSFSTESASPEMRRYSTKIFSTPTLESSSTEHTCHASIAFKKSGCGFRYSSWCDIQALRALTSCHRPEKQESATSRQLGTKPRRSEPASGCLVPKGVKSADSFTRLALSTDSRPSRHCFLPIPRATLVTGAMLHCAQQYYSASAARSCLSGPVSVVCPKISGHQARTPSTHGNGPPGVGLNVGCFGITRPPHGLPGRHGMRQEARWMRT